MPYRSMLHEAIREAADPIVVFNRAIEQCMALIPNADGASLEMIRGDGRLEYVAATGTLAPFVGLALDIEGSLSGRSVLTGEVQLSNDAGNDPRVNAAAVAKTGLLSMLCVPLTTGTDFVASLKISSRSTGAFSPADVRTLQQVTEFLCATLRAAAGIAQATTHLLAPANDAETAQSQTARFVANVLAPGLVEQIDAKTLIDDVIARGGITMLLQPIVDLGTGATVSVEALARFEHTSGRPPDWWFSAARMHGLGERLELLAFTSAVATLDSLPAPTRLAVNIGPDALTDPRFLTAIEDAPAERLTIELTEHTHITDYGPVFEARDVLRSRGALLAVDDAGSGYSGLSHLRRLLPDIVKIDRDLVTGVHSDPVRQTLCGALVDFARHIDASVIAEGIENSDEANSLASLGVHRGQGYHFGRPMPTADLLEFLRTAPTAI